MTKPQDVTYFHPPSTLQDKVFSGDGSQPNLDAAAEVIRHLGDEFVRRLPRDIYAIEQALSDLKDNPDDATLRSALFRRVHDLKGQAGTYEYWMITIIGNELCRYIEHTKHMTPRHFKLMRYHVEALKMVVTKRMTGKDPQGGQHMIDTLHSMARQVLQA